jgi:hypothetical protein
LISWRWMTTPWRRSITSFQKTSTMRSSRDASETQRPSKASWQTQLLPNLFMMSLAPLSKIVRHWEIPSSGWQTMIKFICQSTWRE